MPDQPMRAGAKTSHPAKIGRVANAKRQRIADKNDTHTASCIGLKAYTMIDATWPQGKGYSLLTEGDHIVF